MPEATSRLRPIAAWVVLAAMVIAVIALIAGGNPLSVTATEGSVPTASTTSGTSAFSVHDEETVYVTGDPNGKPRDVVVIDWLKLTGSGSGEILDPGPVTAAESLTDDLEPQLTGDGVRWELSVDGARDFFYRAETDKQLPVEVDIVYTLDGVKSSPEELAGASGRLRIDVTVRNLIELERTLDYEGIDGILRSREATYSAPLLAPVKIDVDGRIFTNIEADPEIRNITGSVVSHTFMTFPQPEQTVTIEMDGSGIELEPIVVSVFPKLAGSPDFSVTDGLAELYDGLQGLEQLSRGHEQVLAALAGGLGGADLSELAGAGEGFGQLQAGLVQLETGATDLGRLTEGQIAYLDGIIAGLRSQNYSAIASLPGALDTLAGGIGATKDGVDGLVALLDGQVQMLDAVSASNAGLLATASTLVSASPDATTTALAAGLAQQQMMLAALRDGDPVFMLPLGIADTRDSLEQISDGLGQTLGGLQAIAAGSAPLAGLPAGFESIASALTVLRDGGTVQGHVLPGLVTSRDGLYGIGDGLEAAGEGVGEAAEGLGGLAELSDLLGDLHATLLALKQGGTLGGAYLPGVDTTAEALGTAASGLGDGLSDAEFGKKVIAAMEDDVTAYDTFLGKPEGATGDVRFVFRFDGIEAAAK